MRRGMEMGMEDRRSWWWWTHESLKVEIERVSRDLLVVIWLGRGAFDVRARRGFLFFDACWGVRVGTCCMLFWCKDSDV